MDLRILWCVFLSCITSITASHCYRHNVGSLAKLPHWKDTLSFDDFDYYVIDRSLAEFYYATPNPAPFDPYINYHFTFVKKGNGTYEELSIGETTGDDARCIRKEDLLVTNGNLRKAVFFSENHGYYVTFWSACPASYVIMFRCQSGYTIQNKCPVQDSYIAILVTGTAHDVPMADILRDLCRATGVKFGSDSFRWFFTYGEAKLCAAENNS